MLYQPAGVLIPEFAQAQNVERFKITTGAMRGTQNSPSQPGKCKWETGTTEDAQHLRSQVALALQSVSQLCSINHHIGPAVTFRYSSRRA